VFIKSCIDLANPENSESGDSWFGLGPPLVIGVGFLLFGVVLMFLQQRASPEFFRRRPQVVGPDGTAISAPTVALDEQGGISVGRCGDRRVPRSLPVHCLRGGGEGTPHRRRGLAAVGAAARGRPAARSRGPAD
jgi:hypothetical protein